MCPRRAARQAAIATTITAKCKTIAAMDMDIDSGHRQPFSEPSGAKEVSWGNLLNTVVRSLDQSENDQVQRQQHGPTDTGQGGEKN